MWSGPLTVDDLLICDADDRPIGLAGIMGGADTEISDTTTDVALEMAWFVPVGVARSATRHGLRSEASARFERGVDPYGIDTAIARFVELLGETCPELVVHAGAQDARAGSLPPAERSCAVRVERGQPHPRHPTDRRPIFRRCSTRSGSPSAATATRSPCGSPRGAPTAPRRST